LHDPTGAFGQTGSSDPFATRDCFLRSPLVVATNATPFAVPSSPGGDGSLGIGSNDLALIIGAACAACAVILIVVLAAAMRRRGACSQTYSPPSQQPSVDLEVLTQTNMLSVADSPTLTDFVVDPYEGGI
jgi:hypothetical protein